MLRTIDVRGVYRAHRKMEWCPPMAAILTLRSFAGKCATGAGKVLSRMRHDVGAFKGFADEYEVDYTAKG